MLKKFAFGCFVAFGLVSLGCGDGAVAPTAEEAPMDAGVMQDMAAESLKHMPPEQQKAMKAQMEAQLKEVKEEQK